MPIEHAPLFEGYLTCPHCGHRFAPPAAPVPDLSPLARAILAYDDQNANIWRKGQPVPLRTWAVRVYASQESVLMALRELVKAGYAATIPYGHNGRVQYVGVPSMLKRYTAIAA